MNRATVSAPIALALSERFGPGSNASQSVYDCAITLAKLLALASLVSHIHKQLPPWSVHLPRVP